MPTATRTIRLHKVQAAFRRSAALYRAFVGGIGSGKSWVGAYDLLARARPGRTYMVIGPTYPTLRDSSMKSFLGIARDLGVLDPSALKLSPPPEVRLANGAAVLFRSADNPELLRGPNITGIWLDEASIMPEMAFRIAIGRLREGGEQGWLSASFTPKGPSHWTHEVFATGRPNTALFRSRTGQNPFLPPGFEDTLREQYGDTLWARQELGGEFVQLEGAEFPAHWLSGDDLWFDAWPDDLALKVIALDPSKGTSGRGADYQAHVLVGMRAEGGRLVFYADCHLCREGVVPMTERTASLVREFGSAGRAVDSVVVEENGTMGFMAPALEAAAAKTRVYIPYVCRTNTDNKEFRIRAQLGPPLSKRQFRFRRTAGSRMLVGQLQSFPLDEHDDGPDALATAMKRVAELLHGGWR